MISTDDGIKIMDGGSTSFKPFAAESNKKDDDNTMDIPTPAPFVQVSLQQLKEKLDATPYEVKSSLVYAKQVNADLVNDDHLLGFLYVEKFNIDVSVCWWGCFGAACFLSLRILLAACSEEIASILDESA